MSTKDIIEARRQLMERGADASRAVDFMAGNKGREVSRDPIDDVIPDWVTADFHKPPGSLMGFCDEIAANFEHRYGGEKMRIVGAINAAQLIMGNKVLTPGSGKMMFGTLVAAPTGAGKGAPIAFVGRLAHQLGLEDRVASNSMSSTKQIFEAAIAGRGFMIYNVDDNPNHVISWDEARNGAIGDFGGQFREIATSTVPFKINSPLRRQIMEGVSSVLSAKFIGEESNEQGFIVPRKPGRDGEPGGIDFKAVAELNNEVGRAVKQALETQGFISKPIENFKIIPSVTMTPEDLDKFLHGWAQRGTAGRFFFVYSDAEAGDKKRQRASNKVSQTIINEWSPRIPSQTIQMKYRSDDVKELAIDLDLAIDEVRHIVTDIPALVANRIGQLYLDLACVCAFADLSSREGVTDIFVDRCHLEWGFVAALESLKAYRDFSEGTVESDGLAVTEFEGIVKRIKKIVETKSFQDRPMISVLKNKVYNGKIKTVIDGMTSPSDKVTPEGAVREIVQAIADSRNPPFIIDDINPNRIMISPSGSWDNIALQGRLFTLLNRSLAQLKYVITRKK